jgi:1,4-dihydroxy-2-naphthoate polyprenyltransferase
MDDDKGSIGGIKNPSPVPSSMFYVTVFLDLVSLCIAYYYFKIGVTLLLLSYILASRAYSYRGIRLKKYAIIGYLTVGIFQGPVIYILTKVALGGAIIFDNITIISCLISFLLIGAGYPISQIYQHHQDREDGVHTMSMLLGIRGTFIFSGAMFFIQAVLMAYYFIVFNDDMRSFIVLIICLAPVLIQFNIWMMKTFKDEHQANYDNTMRTNIIGALAMNIFFIYLTFNAIL